MKAIETKTAVFLRLPKELDKKLGQRAAEIGISKNAYIIILINNGLAAQSQSRSKFQEVN